MAFVPLVAFVKPFRKRETLRQLRSHNNNIANPKRPWCNACNYQAVNAAIASCDAFYRQLQLESIVRRP